MYAVLIILLLSVAGGLIAWGLQRKRALPITAGTLVAVATALFFSFMSFWADFLWYDALNYPRRFWTVVLHRALFAVIGGAAAAGAVWLLTRCLFESRKGRVRWIPVLIAAYFGAKWGSLNWDKILLFVNQSHTGVADPILNKDVSFYLFTLPFYDQVYLILTGLCLISLASAFAGLFVTFRNGRIELEPPDLPAAPRDRRVHWLYVNVAAFLAVLAWGRYLDRFHLLYSPQGTVFGAGWTDVKVRLPALTLTIVALAVGAVLLAIPRLRQRIKITSVNHYGPPLLPVFSPLVIVVVALTGIGAVSLKAAPALFQWLRVSPNEISLEKPYIENSIEYTRRAYGLAAVEEKQFPVSQILTRQTLDDNPDLVNNIRLWDWRALDNVYRQFQEIRLYYQFHDVDVDRYRYGGTYRQVMVSARELQPENLPLQSQTFVNRRFKYTHGFGMTLTPVNEFTPQGLPNLLIKDIPPVSAYPELTVDQPRLYYGELTDSHVIVNTEEQEFDYPSGEKNLYNRYDGNGGVQISSGWRKFLLGWKFDGTRFLFSGYPTADSRVLFRRNIRKRAQTLAPFLHFDEDPYIVLADGRMYWILDAYTASPNYPYSEPFTSLNLTASQPGLSDLKQAMSQRTGRFNYIRNAVKVVIDAYHGRVDFYVFEPDDPLIQAWRAIFPNLFKDRDQMPEALHQHIRYPTDLLEIQGLVYSKYHMTDPEVFYNQEDLWVRATETYYGQVQPVDPYYIMWKPPGQDQPEFILMMPFTPKNRQVLIGWIAGMCDPGNYGRLLAYQFPKQKRVLGTQQMETKIDQDRFLSGQLSLWDQRGSRVIRGNVLVIPIGETLLYVEPIYLQSETSAYPELRLVTVMHNDDLSYGHSLDEALNGLFEDRPPGDALQTLDGDQTRDQLVQTADQAFNDYLNALGRKDFDRAAEALTQLQQALSRLKETGAPAPATTTEPQQTDDDAEKTAVND